MLFLFWLVCRLNSLLTIKFESGQVWKGKDQTCFKFTTYEHEHQYLWSKNSYKYEHSALEHEYSYLWFEYEYHITSTSTYYEYLSTRAYR